MTIQHLQRRALKLRDEFALNLRDMRHWNATHPHDEPFDVGFEIVGVALANDVIAAYERGDTTASCHKRLLDHCRSFFETQRETTR